MAQTNNVTKGWQSFYSWCQGGFNIGWEFGQGLILFIPQGLLGPLGRWSQSSLFDFALMPFRWLAKGIVSPICGIIFAILATLPGLVQGAYLKVTLQNKNYDWTTKFVEQYSALSVWGALGISALWLVAMASGYLVLPLLTIPSFSLYLVTVPSMSINAVTSALLFPLLATQIGMGLTTGIHASWVLLEPVVRLGNKNQRWTYVLKGSVDFYLEKWPDAIEKFNEEFSYENQKMSFLYDETFAEFSQQNGQEPSSTELRSRGVLTYYDLQQEQLTLLKTLTQNKKYTQSGDFLAAITDRRQKFDGKFGV